MTSVNKLSDFVWELDTSFKPGMRTTGKVYADWDIFKKAQEDKGLEQVANVAFLPGLVNSSIAMPDIHWGYGFPIGGVAAMDMNEGVITPGGVGFDINCGVRLLRSELSIDDLEPFKSELAEQLNNDIPKGVGSHSRIKLSEPEMEEVLLQGASAIIAKGLGWPEDVEHIEENGRLEGALPENVSQKAVQRGLNQLGSLGAGNHFIEVQRVDEIFKSEEADAFGIFEGQIVVMIHSGSRGFGHQVCTDYIKVMDKYSRENNIELPDRQLAYAPLNSQEGKDYYSAMACAVNYAFSNRQCLAHWTRKAFEQAFDKDAKDLGMSLVYDVAHNIAKFENQEVNGKIKKLCVHRKGATRAFGPGREELPDDYKTIGQPVFIPGDMGTESYVLAGTRHAMEETFGSTCHGAGRVMSRSQARKQIRGKTLKQELEDKGILIRAGNVNLLSEEAPAAYKDVARVVDVCEGAGISLKVARLKPLLVIKG